MGLKNVIFSVDIIVIASLIVVTPQYAYAYIDPGSITILLQVLLAGIAGALFTFRSYVASFFKNLFKINKDKSADH